MSIQAHELTNSSTKPVSSHERNWTVTSLFKSACKVASVATAALLDVADGFVRGMSATLAGVVLVLTLIIPGSIVGALPVFLTAFTVFFLSKAVLADTIAPRLYQLGDVNPKHPLRWLPFLAGVQVAILSVPGPFSAFN